MIKGVNKQIIEINETENKIFEKAVLYVRPEYAELSDTKLYNSANEFIEEISNSDLWYVNTQLKERGRELSKSSNKLIASLLATGLIVTAVVITLLVIL